MKKNCVRIGIMCEKLLLFVIEKILWKDNNRMKGLDLLIYLFIMDFRDAIDECAGGSPKNGEYKM